MPGEPDSDPASPVTPSAGQVISVREDGSFILLWPLVIATHGPGW